MHNAHSTAAESARNFSCYLADDSATLKFGEELSTYIHPGLTIHLIGDLGAGKTTLTRGILHGLGYSHTVKSPTYNLVEIYKISGVYFYHFDFYRFNDYLEWEEAGFREYFNSDSICVVEWPEKAGDLLPKPDLQLVLSILDNGRKIELQACTEAGIQCLKQWRNQKN
ncbi:tRNA (adenosine(37)-N6)-threonylcarbamoyltransferase complex ATPase subunit type 1 TsaE [Nitrosomonas sp.]|uniref:tRNA (adenosine(37)-N6)-threonylcarbamoyltransferase complex ATPase subunit type 1 TsaE n=1 Tax=Nitrosomonas sp. TaxID=42353 RepID=UPI0025F44A95|nr:tRNA (adenosine(37)-N6)-threonylcarbamoyltransferase complex ATPase subunit type 1 TsaE [Nitrosomonas sp.]MBS0587800.1 tRNA (adenosine(37)-N6)-threonylcarbamoyltransferase complex ATPase subunit type 1 TsaE [Pseudomonadota bacterium]MBV6448159.1 tRNA threonylcarbamoyladenosine biosynthesis protein TsaE [Nitrosomonas sp.]